MSATLVPISSSLTPLSLQSTLLSRIAQLRKRQTSSKKTSNQRSTFILDDLHLASLFPYLPGKDEDEDNWSDSLSSYTHPPLINLVSHLAEHKTLHDEERGYTHTLASLRLVGTCTTDGVKDLSLSLLRWMRPVPFISVSNEGLHLILQQRIMTLVKRLPVESIEKAKVLVDVRIYATCSPPSCICVCPNHLIKLLVIACLLFYVFMVKNIIKIVKLLFVKLNSQDFELKISCYNYDI